MNGPHTGFSVRSYMLAWIIVPLILIISAETYFLHLNALQSVTVAYDRTLLATAHAVGDSVRYEKGDFRLTLPLALFEIYENDKSGRYYYRVSKSNGELISGDDDLPFQIGDPPRKTQYPAVVQFYEDSFQERPIRVAVLHQPVFSDDEAGTVVIQVAEPLSIRQESAQNILRDTLLRQGVLLLIVSLAVFAAVTRALKPLYQLRVELDHRSADDLSPLTLRSNVRELRTVTSALNDLMARVGRLVNYQKRFIANASHQLRTPLAVLKTQLQSGLRGDAPPIEAMHEMSATVERSIQLANQMLLLAKVEQRRTQGLSNRCYLGNLARAAVVELSPLIAEKNLDFEIEADDAHLFGDAWLVGELIRNLLNNAIQHTPPGEKLGVCITHELQAVFLRVWNSGEGLPEDQIDQLFEPFSTGFSASGTGLGLAICREIATSLNGTIQLSNRVNKGSVVGFEAEVRFASAWEKTSRLVF